MARAWRYPVRDVASLMIKLADASAGPVTRRRVDEPRAATPGGTGRSRRLLPNIEC